MKCLQSAPYLETPTIMFFQLLNTNQNSIAASCILVLGIIQISLDSWTLYKIQQHEELILFLSGNSIPQNTMHDMTYEQALSYFSKLKRFLSPDLLEILDILQMTAILGIVAGILQMFSSTGALMWKGMTVDIFWLVMNFIASIFLSVAVSFIAIHMIRDVPYHQILLTVTSVNLFILMHIWTVNVIALVYKKCYGGEPSASSSTENLQVESQSQTNSSNLNRTREENTHANTTSTNTTTVVR